MKYVLILPLFFLYHTLLAQVPPKNGSTGDIGTNRDIRGDVSIEMSEAMPPAKPGVSYYQKDGKYGFIDPAGVKQAAIYNKINFASNGFILKKGDLYGLADKKGQVIGNIAYDSLGTVNETAYIVKQKGKYGTISNNGSKILSIKYDKILLTNNSVSFVRSTNSRIQMIFNEQEKAFPEPIESAFLYANVIIIKAKGKFGVINKQLVVPLIYDSIFVSNNEINTNLARNRQPVKKIYSPIDKSGSYRVVSLLTLQNNNKYGLADVDGDIVYPVDNDAVYNQESYRYYSVKKANLFGIYFINSKKKTAIDLDKIYADGLGYVMVIKNQKAGVFDLQGTQLVAFEYDPEFIMQYRMGFRVTKDKKRGIVGKKGEILVPAIYDDVDPFYETGLGDFVKVKLNGKFGIVNLQGKTIIPVEFEWIGEEKGLLKVLTPDRRVGLYDKTGKVIIPAEYLWIMDSDTENSNMLVLQKQDNTYNFLNKKTMQVLLPENVIAYGPVTDQDGLLNPFSSSGKLLLFVKGRNGKMGLLNEITGVLDVPMIYDDIMQRIDADKHVYFSVKSGKKYGLIDESNKPVIPLQYEAINIDLMTSEAYSVIVAKGRKFGTVNMQNLIEIPFKYDDLQRISHSGLYKARVGTGYQVINNKNEIINKGPFDEVANFESIGKGYQALTFYNGKMRVIDEKGKFITSEVAMQPHHGYKTFDELKWALVNALDSKDNLPLKDFAKRIAPSEHLLFYLKENVFTKQTLQYTNVNAVREKYYNDLLKFKLSRWNQTSDFGYKRSSLTNVRDYTLYKEGFVTNARRTDPAFGDTRFMEKVLRDAIKVNGYWISTYFMQRYFEQ
jgi:hypothetical protein